MTEQNKPESPIAPSMGTIVHFGAGRCNELDAYLALQPQHVLLVEADPQQVETLRTRAAGLPQVQVIQAAVSGSEGPATFYRYNLPDANSLHTAKGLLELFPGLKTIERIKLKTVAPAALLQPLDLKANQKNLLVIDVPGEELPALQALQESQQLHLFHGIQLHCGQKPLYEGSQPATKVLQWLQEQGFDIVAKDENHSPDRPCWTLQRNALQLKNRELEQQFAQLKRAHDEQAALLTECIAQLEAANQTTAELEKRANERQAQVEQLTKARDEHAKLTGEYKEELEKLNHAKAELEKLSNERDAQIEQLTRERDEHAKSLSEYKAQLDKANEVKAEDEKRHAEQLLQEKQKLEQQLGQLQVELDQRSKVEAELKQELVEARQTASLSVKLQTLREADLKDLQTRYRESQEIQESQHQLLVKLSERLSAASTYFHQLTSNAVVPISQNETEKRITRRKASVKTGKSAVKGSPSKSNRKKSATRVRGD